MSSKDLCTVEKLGELLPYVDWLKIEWRSKSEFYVASCVKAYKHVRDSILSWEPINENIKNLVYSIPHRDYWDGFLFNDVKKDFPDWEEEITDTTTHWTAWPEWWRNYFGLVEPETMELNWKKYFKLTPKDNILVNDEFKYVAPYGIWTIKVLDILSNKKENLEMAHCNMEYVWLSFDDWINGWEVLYK
jgi:hypothetical protein